MFWSLCAYGEGISVFQHGASEVLLIGCLHVTADVGSAYQHIATTSHIGDEDLTHLRAECLVGHTIQRECLGIGFLQTEDEVNHLIATRTYELVFEGTGTARREAIGHGTLDGFTVDVGIVEAVAGISMSFQLTATDAPVLSTSLAVEIGLNAS